VNGAINAAHQSELLEFRSTYSMLFEFSLICGRKSDDSISFQNRQIWRNSFGSISDFGDFGDFQKISTVVVIAAVDSRLV
jgi:hypothetical protein